MSADAIAGHRLPDMFFVLPSIFQAYSADELSGYYGMCSGLVHKAKYLRPIKALMIETSPISRVVSQ